MPNIASDVLLGRPRHVGRLSLSQLEGLVVEAEQRGEKAQKAGVAVVQRVIGGGRRAPRLFVMTETTWRRLTGGAAIAPPEVEASVASSGLMYTVEPEREPVPRPNPEVVREAVRTLGGERVLKAMIVQALRDQTGCSRAGAYRAVGDALAAGRIRENSLPHLLPFLLSLSIAGGSLRQVHLRPASAFATPAAPAASLLGVHFTASSVGCRSSAFLECFFQRPPGSGSFPILFPFFPLPPA